MRFNFFKGSIVELNWIQNIKKYTFFSLIFFIFFISYESKAESALDTIKGIGTSIKNFFGPLGKASFWQGIGRGFGAAPTGYVYNFMVHNDTDTPAWVATQNLVSVMGGVFPEAGGFDINEIAPYKSYGQDEKPYYFEFFIKTTNKTYSNHMPYLQHDGVLLQLEKINVIPGDKNSQHRNHFRVYMGKDLVDGSYQHRLKAEHLGYENMENTKDKNALQINSIMTTLSIKNSTQQDYYIGFTTKQIFNIGPISNCQMVGFLEKDSFGLLSAVGSITTFRSGTIGIYDNLNSDPIHNVEIKENGFASFSYTLEIYKDAGKQNISCQWQGITPGHYDMPTNRVKDITPIIGCFWYQAANQVKTKRVTDLAGTIWIVSIEKNPDQSKILAMVQPGQVVTFTINRPNINNKKELYFLYVDESNVSKAEIFVQNFLSGKIGADIINTYHQRLTSIMQHSSIQLHPVTDQSSPASSTQPAISQNLMNEISSDVFDINRGQIIDTSTGTQGFLLGYDAFLSLGIGSGPFYYVLAPSSIVPTKKQLPTSSVNNLLTQQPKNLPTTMINSSFAPTTYAIA